MDVLLIIAAIVICGYGCKKLFAIGNDFVNAFADAHHEIEEEAKTNPDAYGIKFYSPNR